MAPTVQLSNITLSSTNNSIPIPFFGLQDALNTRFNTPRSSSKFTSLFPNACEQDDYKHNCTTSCLNNKQMFASLDTLHNCVVWPSIYVANARDELRPYAAGLAKSLGLEKGSERSSLPSMISNNIQNCLLASCDADDQCGQNANLSFPSGGFRKHYSAEVTGDLYYGSNRLPGYFNPCQYINAPATADVAGVGVFISYAMQLGLALIAFVMAIPWRRAARSVRGFTLRLLHRSRVGNEASGKSSGYKVTKSVQQGSNGRGAKHTLTFDPASAIVPAVVEFQKAQCYFMLATNIASLIIQEKGGLAPESFQQLYNTYIFIKVIAIGGYLPITFGLLTLRMLHKVGWYVLALSIASIGVAIGDLYREQNFAPSMDDLTHLQSQSVQGGPVSCGGNNPIAWCYSRIGINSYAFRSTNTGDGADAILAFCLVVLGVLIIEHFWTSPDPTNKKIRNAIFGSCVRRSNVDQLGKGTRIARWLWKWVVPTLFVVVVLIYLYCFAFFANDLNWFREHDVYDPSWGFGQIVAILIWAPPVFEYFWESFRGIEEGSDHRLPPGFEVRRKEVKTDGDAKAMRESQIDGDEA